jgi:hypothetical protein
MPRTPQEMTESIARNLPEKTGKTLDQWLELLRAEPFEKHGERVKWLMAEHGLTRGYAGAIAWKAGADEVSPEEMVDRQYAGDRAELRPIYERLVAAVIDIGGIVEPRNTYVAFTNDRQFALAQASARTRLDLGLALGSADPTERLKAAGSFGSDRITHKVELAAPGDVDDEVKAWLAEAFGAAARGAASKQEAM